MMDWYKIISCFFTTEIRMILGLCFVVKLLRFSKLDKKAFLLSAGGGAIVTLLTVLALPQFYLIGIEIAVLIAIVYDLFREETRLCLFLIFFYEIGIALWEFLISAGLGVLLHDERFVNSTTTQYMIAVWIVRLLMFCVMLLESRKKNITRKEAIQPAHIIAIVGMFGVIALSGENVVPITDDQLTTWVILSLVLLMAVLFFNLNRQYEMEKEITRLRGEKAELLERDYQALNKTYSANAKLYHDIHNHIEVMYRYLEQGNTEAAIQYLDDLRTPVQEIAQTVWTGDEAIDYLINSKMTFAEQQNIQTKLNIEFPRNTNIRSVDLTAILGNLLDNALEAVIAVKDNMRFINLTIRRINNMLIIKVENSFDEQPVVTHGELQTSKSDKSLHGWGLKSALSAAERYDGTIEISCENHVFQAVVTLSYRAVE